MAITVNPLSHLERVTAWANEPNHPLMGSPFSVECLGKRWAVGTSRAFAVAVRRDEFVREIDPKYVEHVRQTLFVHLPASGKAPACSLARLKEWCGEAAWLGPETCPACDGERSILECSFCNDVGKVVQLHDERLGWLGEVLIDRTFLAWVLAPFDDEHVAVCTRGQRGPVHIIGKSWIVTVMPRWDHAKHRDAPSLFMMAEPERAG